MSIGRYNALIYQTKLKDGTYFGPGVVDLKKELGDWDCPYYRTLTEEYIPLLRTHCFSTEKEAENFVLSNWPWDNIPKENYY